MKHSTIILFTLSAGVLTARGARADWLIVEGPSLPKQELGWLRMELANQFSNGPEPPGVSVRVQVKDEDNQWCAHGSLRAWDAPTPEEFEKRCAQKGRSRLGTESYAPSHAVLSRLVVEPLASDVARHLASRWQLHIDHPTLQAAKIVVGEADAKAYLVNIGSGAATLSVKAGGKVTVSVGPCTRTLDASTPSVDLEQVRAVRAFSPVWFSEGKVIDSLALEAGDISRLTLRIDAPHPPKVLSVPCSGAISANIMGDAFIATPIETKAPRWTWSVEAKKSPGVINVGLHAADSQSDAETVISLPFEPPWWARLWVKITGAVVGVGALLKAVMEINKTIQDLRGKKDTPSKSLKQENAPSE